MTTTLDKPLRREIDINGHAYTVVLDTTSLKITRKAHRKGIELKWTELIHGDETAAHASDARD